MALTRQVVEARLEELRAGFAQAEQEREAAHIRMLTLDGAIQSIEWLLTQLDPESPEQEPS